MTTTTLLAALLAGLAIWWWTPVRAPALRGPRRLRRELPTLLQPRPGAPALRLRILIAVLLVAGVLAALPGAAGLVLALLAGPAAVVALGRLESGDARRGRARVVLELPETLDLLAAALESGAPLRLAVAEVAAAGPPSTRVVLQSVQARVGIGVADADAWRSLADDPDWGMAARDLARSAETGSAAAQVLRQHATDARNRRRDEMLKRARAVGVRSVLPLMCCFLPAFLLTGVVPIVAGLVGQVIHR